jgi:uncharacterized protein YqgC (DUF456 family)
LSPIEVAGSTIFILALFLGLFSIIFGLPGTIIILLDVVVYGAVTRFETIGFKAILALLLLAAAAEALEFFVGMTAALRFGLSLKTFWASVIGGIVGAMVMTPFFFGLGAILGTFLGGFAGVFLYELVKRSRLKQAFRASYGAILGRVAGTMAKGFLAIVMIIIALTSIYS